VIGAAFVVSLLAGCAAQPREADIEQALRKWLVSRKGSSKDVHGHEMGWTEGHIEVESVKVLRVGSYDRGHKYWPVKARIVATHNMIVRTGQSSVMLPDREYRSDFMGVFHIRRDEFGDWEAAWVRLEPSE
jgi:hypothetical protein